MLRRLLRDRGRGAPLPLPARYAPRPRPVWSILFGLLLIVLGTFPLWCHPSPPPQPLPPLADDAQRFEDCATAHSSECAVWSPQ